MCLPQRESSKVTHYVRPAPTLGLALTARSYSYEAFEHAQHGRSPQYRCRWYACLVPHGFLISSLRLPFGRPTCGLINEGYC